MKKRFYCPFKNDCRILQAYSGDCPRSKDKCEAYPLYVRLKEMEKAPIRLVLDTGLVERTL